MSKTVKNQKKATQRALLEEEDVKHSKNSTSILMDCYSIIRCSDYSNAVDYFEILPH